MVLKRNLVANYASHVYVNAASLLVIPIYLSMLGAEALGVLAFYSLTLTAFNLLDMGMPHALSREAARSKATGSARDLRHILRSMQGLFLLVSLGITAAAVVSARWIATSWLNAGALETDSIVLALQLMAVAAGVRFVSGIYKGVITGFEQQVWLSFFNSASVTTKSLGVLVALWLIAPTLTVFFVWQVVVSVVELAWLATKVWRAVPQTHDGSLQPPKPVGPVIRFSIAISVASVASVLASQADKVVLSTILPLDLFGYFSLAAAAATAVVLMTAPVSTALMPRLSQLIAMNDVDGVRRVYRGATQVVAITAGMLGNTLLVAGPTVLYLWTGDQEASSIAGPTASIYAAAHMLGAVNAFPYYLLFAHGTLRGHVRVSLVLLIVTYPAMYLTGLKWGSMGTGAAWLGVNIVFLLSWVPFVHSVLVPRLHQKWLVQDVATIYGSGLAAAYIVRFFIGDVESRSQALFHVIAIAAAAAAASLAASSELRKRFAQGIPYFQDRAS